jgi:hypothetical protein
MMATQSPLGSGSKRVSLHDGETVISSYPCLRRIRGWWIAGGTLFLTENRLIWTPSFFFPLASAVKVERSAIIGFETLSDRPSRFLSPNHWRVCLPGRAYDFSFGMFPDPKNDENLKAIMQWANI